MDKFTWTMLIAVMTMCLVSSAAVKVSEVDCTKDGTDQCKGTPNAECDSAESNAKCKCSHGYAENRNDGIACVKTVSGTTCSDNGNQCGSIKNSHCGGSQCKCDAGYVMNVEICSAESAAPMVQFGWMTIFLGMLTIVLPHF